MELVQLTTHAGPEKDETKPLFINPMNVTGITFSDTTEDTVIMCGPGQQFRVVEPIEKVVLLMNRQLRDLGCSTVCNAGPSV